jgi:uncharacterized protein YqjF (DUF2071 family)
MLDVVRAHHPPPERPWPAPASPWMMAQTWRDVLFAHWPVDAAALAARLPPGFAPDLFAGHAWVGVLAFQVTGASPRGLPALPWISEFPQVNAGVYVCAPDGRPGVLFLSGDLGSSLAVRAAKALFDLPYYAASMRIGRSGSGIDYECERAGGETQFAATYRPGGPGAIAPPGTFEHFFAERFLLYYLDGRRMPRRLEIDHRPWRLCRADGALRRNSLTASHRVALRGDAPILHFAQAQDVLAWPPTRV